MGKIMTAIDKLYQVALKLFPMLRQCRDDTRTINVATPEGIAILRELEWLDRP
jgi:hypothetical protein